MSAAVAESFRHGFNYAKAYDYELVAGKDLLKYRIEQQAQIIQDFYLRQVAAAIPTTEHMKNADDPSIFMPLYFQVLANFLNDPGYPRRVAVCNRNTHGPPGSRGLTCTRAPLA